MDEFVTEIRGHTVVSEISKRKSSKFRDLLGYVLNSSPEIKIIDFSSEEGDIVFEVTMKSLGVSYEILLNYKDEISSDFAANFIGELLVRENIDKFAKIMTGFKDDYLEKVNRYIHRKFGMKICRDKFVLRFHVSLVQNILTEDFKKKMVL